MSKVPEVCQPSPKTTAVMAAARPPRTATGTSRPRPRHGRNGLPPSEQMGAAQDGQAGDGQGGRPLGGRLSQRRAAVRHAAGRRAGLPRAWSRSEARVVPLVVPGPGWRVMRPVCGAWAAR